MEATAGLETENEGKAAAAFVSRVEEDEDESNTVTVTLINPRSSPTDCNTLKRQAGTPPRVDLSRADLIRLLSYLEGELQARDVVIATLKAEKAKQMLYQAKYGRLGLNDPFAALQRDSETCGAKDDFDEASVGRLYESQLAHLERLIAVQRRAHQRAKQVLAAAERRHARSVRELEQEKKRRAHDAAQGDDVCMMLEKERERLKQELENQKGDQGKVEKDLEKARQGLGDEKERHKQIVMYLLQERRQLLVRLMEERQKASKAQERQTQAKGDEEGTVAQKSSNTDEDLLKRVESLKQQLEEEKKETSTLREVVKSQEEDLNLIRQMILAKSRQAASQQHSPVTGSSKTLTHAKTGRNECANSGGGQVGQAATASTSPVTPEGKGQPLARPVGTQRAIQHHYAATDLDCPSTSAAAALPQQAQQPIRLLTNPAYQQQPSAYHGAAGATGKSVTPTRTRPVPPPAPRQPASIVSRPGQATADRTDAQQATHAPSSSTYAAPRVIPIQLIGPTPNSSAGQTISDQQQHYASVSAAGGLRRPAVVAGAPSGNQGGVVSAARNYVSTVVAAVTNAATNSPLLSGGVARRSAGAPSSSGSGTHWPHLAQTTSSSPAPLTNDGAGYRTAPAVNVHRAGESIPSYSVPHQGQTPTGSVARKGNPAGRPQPAPASGQQQVSDNGGVQQRADTVAAIKEQTGGPAEHVGGRRAGNDPHGVKRPVSSRRPPVSPQQHNLPSPLPTNGRLPSPATTASSSPVTPNGVAAQGKRTPTPAPSDRIPLPAASNGAPAPAAMKTSALSGSPSASTTDCSAQQSTQGTLGRKVKAMSGLANKIQRRVVAGVSGQLHRPQEERQSREQNIRSTQV